MNIALIDYGAGNLTSVRRGLRRAGLEATTPTDPSALQHVRGILVPGVGHFGATAAITEPWRLAILNRVRAGVPLLGICLGMQWLFDGSAEEPGISGMGLLGGMCDCVNGEWVNGSALKVPHLGWNTLARTAEASRLLDGIDDGAFAYFAHSFAAPIGPDTVAVTTHGSRFAAVIERDNIFGAQFHPELSAQTGERIFANFARVVTQ